MMRSPREARWFSYRRPIRRGELARQAFVIQTEMCLSLPQKVRTKMCPNHALLTGGKKSKRQTMKQLIWAVVSVVVIGGATLYLNRQKTAPGSPTVPMA